MDNPGLKSLATETITVARTAVALSSIDNLDGITAVTLEAAFAYGAGGTTCFVVVQTNFDDTTWRDIARFDFTTASATKHCNLEGLLSKAVTAYVALAAEGVYDGVLGSSLRAVITSTGTYSNTVLSVKASVR
jgi:hypothetical protein